MILAMPCIQFYEQRWKEARNKADGIMQLRTFLSFLQKLCYKKQRETEDVRRFSPAREVMSDDGLRNAIFDDCFRDSYRGNPFIQEIVSSYEMKKPRMLRGFF